MADTPYAAEPLTARMVEDFRTINLEEAEGMRHRYPEGVADERKRRINMICDAALSGIVSESAFATETVDKAELERLRAYQRTVEESEGRCCPEDVGFEEWIGILTSKLKESYSWLMHMPHREAMTPLLQWLGRWDRSTGGHEPSGSSSAELRSFDQDALDRASWELQRHFGREGSIYGIEACEEIARIALTAYGSRSATTERSPKDV